MTTAGDIITRALRPMRDASQEYFVDGELNEYINDAIEDLCSRERIFSDEQNLAFSSGSAAIPANVLQVRWLKNPDGIEAVWLDPSTFNEYELSAPDWSEDAPLATNYDDMLRVWPVNDGTWELGAWVIPDAIDADADTIPTPRVWDKKIVRYLRAQCYYRLGEEEMGDRELAQYEMGLRPASATRDRNQPGMVTLSIGMNTFDADLRSVHRGR